MNCSFKKKKLTKVVFHRTKWRRSLESEQTHELLEVLLGSLMWLLQGVGVAAPPLNPFLNWLQRWALQLVWPSRPSPYHQARGPNNYKDTKPSRSSFIKN